MPLLSGPRLLTVALLVSLAGPTIASAQQAAPTPPSPTVPAPGDGPNAAPSDDRCASRPAAPATGDGDLSSQLSDCGGVLTPPATTDGGIHVPAPDPDPNTTPVIPPGQIPSQPANPAEPTGRS